MTSKLNETRDVKVMKNWFLFVLFFVICYLLVEHRFIQKQVNQFQKKNLYQESAKENSFQKILSKINLIKTKENNLFLQGYPLKLHAISYYLIKISFLLLFITAGIINYHSYFVALILGFFGFFFLDWYLSFYQKTRNNEICSDLLTVTNSITMQLASYVPLKESLKNQYENCRNKDFRKAMMLFSTKYELSEYNVDTALNELNARFDLLEVDMFCHTIRQYNQVGNIIELLENLSNVLKQKYIQQLKIKTKEKVLYITFGVIVALSNMILITFYPLFVSIGNNFQQIFQ